MASKGVVVWRGDFGGRKNHYGKTVVRGVTTDAALNTLIGVLDGYTVANAAKRSFNSIVMMVDAAPGVEADMDGKLVCVMKDTTTDLPTRLEIPAPDLTKFEATPDGLRLTAANLATLVTGINTATGRSLSGLFGAYWHKS